MVVSFHLSVHLSISPPLPTPVGPPFHPSVCQSVSLLFCRSVHLSVNMSGRYVCLTFCLSIWIINRQMKEGRNVEQYNFNDKLDKLARTIFHSVDTLLMKDIQSLEYKSLYWSNMCDLPNILLKKIWLTVKDPARNSPVWNVNIFWHSMSNIVNIFFPLCYLMSIWLFLVACLCTHSQLLG